MTVNLPHSETRKHTALLDYRRLVVQTNASALLFTFAFLSDWFWRHGIFYDKRAKQGRVPKLRNCLCLLVRSTPLLPDVRTAVSLLLRVVALLISRIVTRWFRDVSYGPRKSREDCFSQVRACHFSCWNFERFLETRRSFWTKDVFFEKRSKFVNTEPHPKDGFNRTLYLKKYH